MPAGSARRNENVAGPHRFHGGQQFPIGNRFRHFIPMPHISERTGHAAAARVEIHHAADGMRESSATVAGSRPSISDGNAV